MADSEPPTTDGDSQVINEPGDIVESEITQTQTETEELVVFDDITMAEEEEDETVTELEAQTLDDAIELKHESGDDELNLLGENTFEADVVDEAGIDDDEDEEENKEIHEGDGEHEDKDEAMEEDEEEEEDDDAHGMSNQDPNVMPQVNVAVLAQRKWQVKVYPLKPSDFMSGQIARAFKHARESLLYLLSPGRNARGKGEMYVSSANQAVRCVHSLMRLEYSYPEINVEVIKKNDEGAIEEKAYFRFDSKLTQILTMRPTRRGHGAGRKRDRMIGSVFLKNLPPGTTKDTLRVMFPFAQEINYNPEKFKDCTARLVLQYRSHVIPCLKAFAKVELGGNVLELHPLAKRKRTRTDDDTEASDAKQRKKSDEPKKDDLPKKTEEITKKPSGEKKDVKKENEQDSKERSNSKTTEKKDHRSHKNKAPQKSSEIKPFQNRNRSRKPPASFGGQKKDKRNDNTYRPKLVGGKERSSSFSSQRGNKPRPDRSPASSSRSFRDDRSRRDFGPGSSRFGNRNSRSRGSGGGGRQTQGSLGRSSYSMGGSGLGMGAAMTASDANLAVNAEATKEMVLLQNQLSMAIKNQLAMLNQTTMAVEQAKRGASSIGLRSELQSSMLSPKGLGAGGSSSRRSLDQYRPASSVDDSLDHYGDHERSRPKTARRGGSGRGGRGNSGGRSGNRGGARGGGSGGGSSGFSKRVAASSYRDEVDDWERETAAHFDPYGSSQEYGYDRNISSFGSSARSSYNQDSGYSGYF